MPEDLLSGGGAARLLGCTRQYVHQLASEARAKRDEGTATAASFPAPYGTVDETSAVWRRADIEAWNARRAAAAA